MALLKIWRDLIDLIDLMNGIRLLEWVRLYRLEGLIELLFCGDYFGDAWDRWEHLFISTFVIIIVLLLVVVILINGMMVFLSI